MERDDPFCFFEIVCVAASDRFPDLVGRYGFVRGKSWRYEEPTPHGPVDQYGVKLFGEERLHTFEPHKLRSSGYILATQTDGHGHVRPVGAYPIELPEPCPSRSGELPEG